MTLRRDERGRALGLDWDALRPTQDPQAAPSAEPAPSRRSTGFPPGHDYVGGGRPRQDLCGAGLHDMSVHGRERKSGGGRYCNECKNERARKYTREGRRKSRAKQPETGAVGELDSRSKDA